MHRAHSAGSLATAREGKTGKNTYQKNQHPPIQRHLVQDGEVVGPRDDVQQQRRSKRSLIRQQLHAVHAELCMVESHPYRVNRTANDTAERKDHAQQGCLFAVVALMRQRVKVRGHSHSEADWNKGKDGRSRQGLLVQEEVDRGDRGREEDAADLVEGDGGVGEGEVLEYHVQTHRSGQREHFEDFGPFELEETDAGPGECVE